MEFINQENLNKYINEFIIILKEYNDKKNNKNIEKEISEKINIKIFNNKLECNIISNILKDDKRTRQFENEIKNKIIGPLIQKYIEIFELNKTFDNILESLIKQGKGLYNIINDPEQLDLAIDILTTGNLIVVAKRPIIFTKLNYNLALISQSNADMKNLKGQGISEKFVSESKSFLSKNLKELDVKKVAEYINDFKRTIDKNFGQEGKNIFNLLISDKDNFSKVFSFIYSRLKLKMQDECKNISNEDIKKFEDILKKEVEDFNKNRITFVLKIIKNKLENKVKSSSSEFVQGVTGKDVGQVKKEFVKGVNYCLNNPEKCQKKVENAKETALNIYKKFK